MKYVLIDDSTYMLCFEFIEYIYSFQKCQSSWLTTLSFHSINSFLLKYVVRQYSFYTNDMLFHKKQFFI